LERQGGFLRVLVAFLEIERPSIPAAFQALVEAGMDEVVLLPFFLLPGRHTRRDLPALVRAARRAYPRVRFRLAPSIGFDPALSGVLRKRARG
jgi:sirohydrochlorin cobaltochelatase